MSRRIAPLLTSQVVLKKRAWYSGTYFEIKRPLWTKIECQVDNSYLAVEADEQARMDHTLTVRSFDPERNEFSLSSARRHLTPEVWL